MMNFIGATGILFIMLCGYSAKLLSTEPLTYQLQNIDIGIAFPPVKNKAEQQFSYNKLKELNVKRIRFAENWKYREPNNNQFNWQPLDERINYFFQHNIDVILTIQSDGPDWIKSNSISYNKNSIAFSQQNNIEFVAYLEQLLLRYRGKINAIQFANEWQSKWWYSGSKEEFTRTQNLFYATVKKIDPDIKVILGGFSISALRALAASQGLVDSYINDAGKHLNTTQIKQLLTTQKAQNFLNRVTYVLDNARYDIIDAHLYDDPQNWHHYIAAIKALKPQTPIVVLEFGGPNTQWVEYSDALHKTELLNYIKALDQLDIAYALYFRLIENSADNHEKSGLLNEQLEKKPAYYLFQRITTHPKAQ